MKPKVICVILGGGRGTRLHPLTQARCKPAVPLAGKYRLVDIPISNCLNSGYNKIYLLSQFNTASLHRHIQESYKFDPFGGGFVDILSAEQTETGEAWYQGTADAVRQNLHHYNAQDGDIFLILSGDQLYRMDLNKIVEQHRQTKADVTIAAKVIPKEEVSALGVMKVNDDLTISEFFEKPKDPQVIQNLVISDQLRSRIQDPGDREYCLASMGIYVFNKETMFAALSNPDQTDFGKEIIPELLGNVKMCSHIFDGYWEDIGTVRSFFDANLRLTDPVPPFNFFEPEKVIYTHARYLPAAKINGSNMNRVIIGGGCIISDTRLNRCVIGVRSVINEGCDLDHVIVMGQDYYEDPDEFRKNKELGRPNLGIGKNCKITNAIIDKNARIGNNVTLSPENKAEGFEQNGIYVKDGVLLVAKNAIVPDGTTI